MSDAAERYVAACAHPDVNDVARNLLGAIARLVPEGQTTTPTIGMADLAKRARMHRRTVWRWLDVLVAIGEVRVVDGGQGRPARYTLVHVAGAPPITAAELPLRADLQAVRPRPSRPVSEAPGLFDEPPVRRSESEDLVIGPITRITSWAARTITRITSWAAATITRITSGPFVRSDSEELVIRTCDPCDPSRSDGEELVIGTCDPCDPATAIEAVLTTARDVQQLKRTTTTGAAPRAGPRAVESPPCRWRGTKHAWCDGRVHVPMPLHVEERRKLARQPGETDADLDAQLFTRYAERLAAIPDTEEIRDKNEFEFWKRVLRSTSAERTANRGPRRDGSTCPHQPRCRTDRECIERVITDGRAARERQTG